MRDFTFRFDAVLRVTLQNGEVVQRQQEVAVEAAAEEAAASYLPTIATEMCHDAGSRWFDAPVERVEVLSHRCFRDSFREAG